MSDDVHNSASATSKPIVIIGSGIGGLTLGARLARKGRKVVVLEQHRRHGGYATTFVRKRIEFEVSLHMIGDLAEGCRLRSVLEELGVWQTVEFLRSSSLYKASLPGVEIDIRGDAYGGYLERLCGLYPEESRGLPSVPTSVRHPRLAQLQERAGKRTPHVDRSEQHRRRWSRSFVQPQTPPFFSSGQAPLGS